MSAADAIALDGYRAAAAFIGADSWDGCSDCMDILKAAKATDILYNPTPDDTATALRSLRSRYWGEHAPQSITPPEVGGELVEKLQQVIIDGVRECMAQVVERHIDMKLCRSLAPKAPGVFFAAARHLADDIRNEADFRIADFLAKRPAYKAVIAALSTPEVDTLAMGPPPPGVKSYWPDENGNMVETTPGVDTKALVEALEKARNQFAFYGQQHRAKLVDSTPTTAWLAAQKKAEVNEGLVREFDAILSQHRGVS